jgi:hypothetical protein
MSSDMERRMQDQIEGAQCENDRLRTEVERLQGIIKSVADNIGGSPATIVEWSFACGETLATVGAAHEDAARYRWLRARDLDTIDKGGVFAGLTTGMGYGGKVLNGEDLDRAIDTAIACEPNPAYIAAVQARLEAAHDDGGPTP